MVDEVPSPFDFEYETSGAVLVGPYRYKLWRTLREVEDPRVLTFVMLNPSTADDCVDDPTIRRCLGFAECWGYDVLTVVNLFALRSTDPRGLRVAPDPVGPQNDVYLEEAAKDSVRVIAAWGNHAVWNGPHSTRSREVVHLVGRHRDLYCFGRTAQDQPRHPLYVRRDETPEVFWRRDAGGV